MLIVKVGIGSKLKNGWGQTLTAKSSEQAIKRAANVQPFNLSLFPQKPRYAF